MIFEEISHMSESHILYLFEAKLLVECKGVPARCSVTQVGGGGLQPGGLKKFYFYNDMYLFLTRIARHRDFRDVCFDFECGS